MQVRVVSVGPIPHTIDELVANPDNDDWMKLSVEFCGGEMRRGSWLWDMLMLLCCCSTCVALLLNLCRILMTEWYGESCTAVIR